MKDLIGYIRYKIHFAIFIIGVFKKWSKIRPKRYACLVSAKKHQTLLLILHMVNYPSIPIKERFVLFSHPADFTPVCTTEFVGFQGIYDQLKELNTELVGLSIDSISSHIAWIRNIEENFNTKIMFPVIADLNKNVATKFGMIMPESNGTETSRAVFVIDDKATVRSVIYYPLPQGATWPKLFV
ncbi:redoxin domain-containing protein [Halobacillus amylolyticus]|uniref:redoxin domain-containing protein n=1 Tax=Halobacillus amylolyticus TaxID=2932259 RepID=UPI00296237F0|nr:redoxin domain-containing protein [Halobacillus amylolyticus]